MPNQYVNHVVINGQTKLDLRSDTVDASHLAQGYTAHDASGAAITGTMSGGGGGSVVIVDTQDSHGGTIRTITSDVTVQGTTNITQNGVYDVSTYATANVSVSGGSSLGSVYQDSDGYLVLSNEGYDDVVFHDYDGTVLHTYTKSQFLALESMPANPDHTADGLTSQGWNWTLADAKTHVQAYGKASIGQMYIPTDGKTHFYVTISADMLDIKMRYYQLKKDGMIINWGDGSADEIIVTQGNQEKGHSYPAAGDYEITVWLNPEVNGNTFYFAPSGSNTNAKAYQCVFSDVHMLKHLRLGYTGQSSVRAFAGCVDLETVTIPDNYDYGYYSFTACYSLKHVVVPKLVTYVQNYMFNFCYSLQTIDLPYGLTAINSGSLNYAKLRRLDIPGTVRTITLDYLYSLESITIPSSANNTVMITACYHLKEIKNLKNTSITTLSLSTCYNLEFPIIDSSVLPSTCTTLKIYGCFYGVKSITVPPSVTVVSGTSNFASNCAMKTITLHDGLSLPASGLYNNYSLENVTLPSDMTSIPASLFGSCYALEHVSIPSTVTSIGESAFSQCYSLLDIEIPSNVTTIGKNAFYYCQSLESITIPANVTSIGNGAFSYMQSAKEYHFLPATPPTLGTDAFKNILTGCVIYVPQASLSAYQSAENWSTWASYMVGE